MKSLQQDPFQHYLNSFTHQSSPEDGQSTLTEKLCSSQWDYYMVLPQTYMYSN